MEHSKGVLDRPIDQPTQTHCLQRYSVNLFGCSCGLVWARGHTQEEAQAVINRHSHSETKADDLLQEAHKLSEEEEERNF